MTNNAEHITILTDMIIEGSTPKDFGTVISYMKRHNLPMAYLRTAIEHSEFISEVH